MTDYKEVICVYCGLALNRLTSAIDAQEEPKIPIARRDDFNNFICPVCNKKYSEIKKWLLTDDNFDKMKLVILEFFPGTVDKE